MMASKFLHDEGEDESVVNEEWATSAHMNVEELNELERHFLAALVRRSRITRGTCCCRVNSQAVSPFPQQHNNDRFTALCPRLPG